MTVRWSPAITLVLLAGLVAGVQHADAAVVSDIVNEPLSATPVDLTLGGGAATYAFTAVSAAVTGNGPGAAVATSGTALVSNFLGLTDFSAGGSIDQMGELYNFAAFPTATLIPNSPADDFIGLEYTVASQSYFGFAEVNGPELVSYGYQTTPNATIVTGVPEPATFAVLAVGVLGIAVVSRRRLSL